MKVLVSLSESVMLHPPFKIVLNKKFGVVDKKSWSSALKHISKAYFNPKENKLNEAVLHNGNIEYTWVGNDAKKCITQVKNFKKGVLKHNNETSDPLDKVTLKVYDIHVKDFSGRLLYSMKEDKLKPSALKQGKL